MKRAIKRIFFDELFQLLVILSLVTTWFVHHFDNNIYLYILNCAFDVALVIRAICVGTGKVRILPKQINRVLDAINTAAFFIWLILIGFYHDKGTAIQEWFVWFVIIFMITGGVISVILTLIRYKKKMQ